MGSLSIIDKQQNNSHLHHFVVQTRSFQIEKARDVDMYENLRNYIKRQNEKKKQGLRVQLCLTGTNGLYYYLQRWK